MVALAAVAQFLYLVLLFLNRRKHKRALFDDKPAVNISSGYTLSLLLCRVV